MGLCSKVEKLIWENRSNLPIPTFEIHTLLV